MLPPSLCLSAIKVVNKVNEVVPKTVDSGLLFWRAFSYFKVPVARFKAHGFVICVMLVIITAMLSLRARLLLPVVSNQLEWRQPALADAVYPQLISSVTWKFQFQPIEDLLDKKLPLRAGPGAISAALLEDVVKQLPVGLADEQMRRIVFLLERAGYPAIAPLIVAFYRYDAAYKAFKVVNNDGGYDQLMVKKAALQRQYLGGKWARQYYQHEQILAEYFLAKSAFLNHQATTAGRNFESLDALQRYFKEHKGL